MVLDIILYPFLLEISVSRTALIIKNKRKTRVKRIEELCLELTEEERELHKDLIEECIDREKKIINSGLLTKDYMNKFIEVYSKLEKDLATLHNACKLIAQNLNSMPESKHQSVETEKKTENNIVH